jgi:hypothetical protein
VSSSLNWDGPSGAARNHQLHIDRGTGYKWLATHDEDWRRALDVQAALWRAGRMRAVGCPDLHIAAVAERERVIPLHYNGDYDLIAQVTGQSVQWACPAGPSRSARPAGLAGHGSGEVAKILGREHLPCLRLGRASERLAVSKVIPCVCGDDVEAQRRRGQGTAPARRA